MLGHTCDECGQDVEPQEPKKVFKTKGRRVVHWRVPQEELPDPDPFNDTWVWDAPDHG